MSNKSVKSKKTISKKHHPKAVKKKHHKPTRVHHISLLSGSLIILCGVFAIIGAQWAFNRFSNTDKVIRNEIKISTKTSVVSDYGFTMPVDLNVFTVEAYEDAADEKLLLNTKDYQSNKNVSEVSVSILGNLNNSADQASVFKVEVIKDANVDQFDASVELLEQKSNDNFDVEVTDRTANNIGGIEFTRINYTKTSKAGNDIRESGVKTYAVDWFGVVDGNIIKLSIEGMVTNLIPEPFKELIGSMSFRGGNDNLQNSVLGATTLEADQIADYASPAVVKVYYGICTDVLLEGAPLIDDYCNGGTGTGFFISSDGYIATNGHVVVIEPVDVVVDFLLSDANRFAAYLEGLGYSNQQAAVILNDTSLVATEISYLYDEYDAGALNLAYANKQEAINVALSDNPLPGYDESIDNWIKEADESDVKSARLIDYNYSGGDSLRAIDINEDTGYENSDVAILKVDVENAPVLELYDGSVTTNQSIIVVGFPGNAENELVKQDKISITATNGVISSIREASGSSGTTVYQSDVAASAGNSGGPALTEEGDVFGLLTYSYRGSSSTDARISYIRDVQDLKDLISENNVELLTQSNVQQNWEKGLQFYSESKLSKAVKEFEKVKEEYPQHRLADTYIANAEKGIADGKDVKDFPLWAIALTAVAALAGVTVGVVLIVRHRVHHQNYKHVEQGFNPPTGSVPPTTPQTPQAPVQQPQNPQVPPQANQQFAQNHPQQSVQPQQPQPMPGAQSPQPQQPQVQPQQHQPQVFHPDNNQQ